MTAQPDERRKENHENDQGVQDDATGGPDVQSSPMPVDRVAESEDVTAQPDERREPMVAHSSYLAEAQRAARLEARVVALQEALREQVGFLRDHGWHDEAEDLEQTVKSRGQ